MYIPIFYARMKNNGLIDVKCIQDQLILTSYKSQHLTIMFDRWFKIHVTLLALQMPHVFSHNEQVRMCEIKVRFVCKLTCARVCDGQTRPARALARDSQQKMAKVFVVCVA